MNIWVTVVRLAIRALMAYKVRSLLTMLGIIIGIGSVIVMISVGRGANESIQDQIRSLGANMLMVFSGSATTGGVQSGYGTKPTITTKDADAIARDCEAVAAVAYARIQPLQIVAGKKNWGARVYGTTDTYAAVRDWPLMTGEFLSEQHMRSASSVVVLGSAVYENLFESGEEVVGQMIRINNVPFRIIGILTPKGRTPGGQDQDDTAFIPYSTMERKLAAQRLPGLVHFILASAQNEYLVDQAKREIEGLLRQRHRIPPGGADDFNVRTLDEFADMAGKTTDIMTYLLTAVAAISLIVGGIGIMNIMLVSVTERTREIGIRMAVGARQGDVLIQFLVEAMVISFVGGILGTIMGVVCAKTIAHLAGWLTIVSIDSILLATLFSAMVGIFFGFYPARKASNLDPIQALRHD